VRLLREGSPVGSDSDPTPGDPVLDLSGGQE
jgi:hypothetical protein